MWNLEQSTIAEWIKLKYLGEQSASSSASSQRHPQQCHHRHHFRMRAVYPNGVGFSSSLPASTCSPPSSSQFAHHRLSRFHVKYIFFQLVPPNKYPTHWSHPTGKKWLSKLQVFNSKTYTGMSTGKYFTSGDFLKFPVKTESPTPPPLATSQQQRK